MINQQIQRCNENNQKGRFFSGSVLIGIEYFRPVQDNEEPRYLYGRKHYQKQEK